MENSATLLLYRQDRKGLVFVITRFLLQHGGNIPHADQHHLGCALEQRQSGTGNTDR
jgi:formyltetrahydrofolate hydrolase